MIKWCKDLVFGESTVDLLRKASIELRKAENDVTFEIQKAEKEEAHRLLEIKSLMKRGKKDVAKQLSLQVSRKRAYVVRCHKAIMQFSSLRDTLGAMKNQEAIAKGMMNSARIMGKMNAKLNIGSLNNLVVMLNKGMISMSLKSEMLDQALDQVDNDFDDNDEVEEDADEVFSQICMEIGMQLEEKMAPVPNKVPEKIISPEEEDDNDVGLEERLSRLKKTNNSDNKE